MIPDRIEKLRFIVEEMQIAFHLATQLTDPFLTRTIAPVLALSVRRSGRG